MRDFPIWTRGRARRHIERGCSIRFVGLIVGAGKRAAPATPAPPAQTSNVLPFRAPARRRPPAARVGA